MIQTGTGPIRVDADDPQFTHRGKTVAVKIRSIAWPQVLGVVKEGDGWKVSADLTGDLFSSDAPGGGDPVAHYMKDGADAFVRSVILPRLNEWLATEFAPGGLMTPLEQLQAALLGVRFVMQPDGTVRAE